jgi:hypothetical protein
MSAKSVQGFECGISLVNYNDLKVEDEIEAFVIEKIAGHRTLRVNGES